jgi:O-antigen/teichoic acid export membrane protein
MHGSSGDQALREVAKASSRYVFLIYVPLAVGLAATAYPVMAWR